MGVIRIGEEVPISLLLADGATDQYPQAEVRDNDDTLLTTLDLGHVAGGLYVPAAAYPMPDEVFLLVTYITYSDAAHTTENTDYARAQDVFVKEVVAEALAHFKV